MILSSVISNVASPKAGSTPEELVVDYIEVTIEEVCIAPGAAAAGAGGSIPNTLDCMCFEFCLLY